MCECFTQSICLHEWFGRYASICTPSTVVCTGNFPSPQERWTFTRLPSGAYPHSHIALGCFIICIEPYSLNETGPWKPHLRITMPSTTYLQLQSDEEEEGGEEEDAIMHHRRLDPVREVSARDKLSANAQAVGQTHPESFFFPFFFLCLCCEVRSYLLDRIVCTKCFTMFQIANSKSTTHHITCLLLPV